MPNIRSSKKDVRRTTVRTARNKAKKNRIKTLKKRVVQALEKNDTATVQKTYNNLASAADKAAKSNTIHKNKASRLKSRMAKKIAKAAAAKA